MAVIRFFWDFRGPDAQKTAEHHLEHVREFFEANSVPFPLTLEESPRPGESSVFFDADRLPAMLLDQATVEQRAEHERGESPESLVDSVGRTLRPTRYELLA